MTDHISDLFIIGGGVNGCGIARDAAGRGLSVTLAEMGDLAQGTSSASTKLFHGGLRYLEYFEFRLVRESLREREVLLRAMPHISWPMRFVLPYSPRMRFRSDTPTSRLMNRMMPWTRHKRPAWLIRLGLFLYDSMGGRKLLPGTRKLDLTRDEAGKPLQPGYDFGWEYSDCCVQDARLVVLNARDAAARGARILTGTRVTLARREGDLWHVQTEGPDGPQIHRARALVNAGGPWVAEIIHDTIHLPSREHIRLVRGSHIVVPRLYDHDRSYFFQGSDGRIIFAIPFEQDFTLIGTTDIDHQADADHPRISDSEAQYLCEFASQYFKVPVTRDQIVWAYSGVRPLYDDGASSATAATRDYVLRTDESGPVVLNVFGGKITTYRRLAEAALKKLAPHFPQAGRAWTAGAPLPGGDFPVDAVKDLILRLLADYPFLNHAWATRLVRAYGTDAQLILGGARMREDLGRDFGADLTEAELGWMMGKEFARTAEDAVWRRSKQGLRLSPAQIETIDVWMAGHKTGPADRA